MCSRWVLQAAPAAEPRRLIGIFQLARMMNDSDIQHVQETFALTHLCRRGLWPQLSVRSWKLHICMNHSKKNCVACKGWGIQFDDGKEEAVVGRLASGGISFFFKKKEMKSGRWIRSTTALKKGRRRVPVVEMGNEGRNRTGAAWPRGVIGFGSMRAWQRETKLLLC